jgi:hypothetical protein
MPDLGTRRMFYLCVLERVTSPPEVKRCKSALPPDSQHVTFGSGDNLEIYFLMKMTVFCERCILLPSSGRCMAEAVLR